MPNVSSLDSLPGAWHWSYGPGRDSCAALSADGEHAFQTHALRSYDESLAVGILSFAREQGANLIAGSEQLLMLVEGFAHPGYAFDAVVAVGPSLHRLYPDDPRQNVAVRAVIPAFRCEFAGDENNGDANYLYNRAAGVQGTRWERQPRPFLKMRLRGDDGHLAAQRGFALPSLLVSWVTKNEGNSNLFVEFENYRHDIYTIEWIDTWTITAPGEAPHQTTFEHLLDMMRAALYGPNIAAGTDAFHG